MSSRCLTRVKYFYMKSAWLWDCFRYHVVFFHGIVSRLAIFHCRVFSLGILEILKRCIASSSLKCLRGCLTRWKYFYVKSAWMWDCFRHHLVFFHCIVLGLAMCHSRVFSLGILEILKRCKVLPSLKCLLGCVTRGKYFYVKTAWIGNCCLYQVVLFLCIVSCLAMCNNCVFGFEMFEILNRWKVPPSIKCGGSLTRVFTDIVFTIGILGILNWCKVSPSLIYPCDFLTVRLRLLSISCNVVI